MYVGRGEESRRVQHQPERRSRPGPHIHVMVPHHATPTFSLQQAASPHLHALSLSVQNHQARHGARLGTAHVPARPACMVSQHADRVGGSEAKKALPIARGTEKKPERSVISGSGLMRISMTKTLGGLPAHDVTVWTGLPPGRRKVEGRARSRKASERGCRHRQHHFMCLTQPCGVGGVVFAPEGLSTADGAGTLVVTSLDPPDAARSESPRG